MHCVLISDRMIDGPEFEDEGRPVPLIAASLSAVGDVMSKTDRNIQKEKKQKTKQRPVNVRKDFPETWLWTEEMVK